MKLRCEKKYTALENGGSISKMKPMVKRVCKIIGLTRNAATAKPAQANAHHNTRSRQRNGGGGLSISDMKFLLSDPDPRSPPASPIRDDRSPSPFSINYTKSSNLLASTSASPQARSRCRKRDSKIVDLTAPNVEGLKGQEDEPPAKKAGSQGE